ncbi:MAG: septal ring lytic transglycosylase RlpA family protein [Leptolyngbyaceae cyanobacterium SL_7_1]|nr:septal ring lytic transglycosylase RlpA family protein [Leptolyngbyaceae cyanobacterium SL_7_1]
MNQTLWSSLTVTALTISSLGAASYSYADSLIGNDDQPQANVSTSETIAATDGSVSNQDLRKSQSSEASKVGEYQSQETTSETTAAIATIYPHPMNDRQAATIYVNNIPVLTVLGSRQTPVTSPESTSSDSADDNANDNADVKVGSIQAVSASTQITNPADTAAAAPPVSPNSSVDRATAIAAQLNQLHQSQLDPATITVRWNTERQRYLILMNGAELVEINADTILPDTTGDAAEDALQATNRLRRLMGGAAPLTDIEGRPRPRPEPQVSRSNRRALISGLASWYGPGFNGRRSASGEIFNQNAMTAAHRTLPFGTRVRVTNPETGQSVVVRINDRGPFSGRRVIDLSRAAAGAIGLIPAGVAPVNLEVLGRAR